jgi:hypothetical protein
MRILAFALAFLFVFGGPTPAHAGLCPIVAPFPNRCVGVEDILGRDMRALPERDATHLVGASPANHSRLQVAGQALLAALEGLDIAAILAAVGPRVTYDRYAREAAQAANPDFNRLVRAAKNYEEEVIAIIDDEQRRR